MYKGSITAKINKKKIKRRDLLGKLNKVIKENYIPK